MAPAMPSPTLFAHSFDSLQTRAPFGRQRVSGGDSVGSVLVFVRREGEGPWSFLASVLAQDHGRMADDRFRPIKALRRAIRYRALDIGLSWRCREGFGCTFVRCGLDYTEVVGATGDGGDGDFGQVAVGVGDIVSGGADFDVDDGL